MKRREFITLLGGAAAVWPLAVRAQQVERKRRIGVLMAHAENDAEFHNYLSAFREGLQKLGWAEGRNIQIDARWGALDDAEARQRSAKELVALQPDLILTQNTPPTASMLEQTRTIPLVFVIVADPVGSGFVQNLARPGANATGFTIMEPTVAGSPPAQVPTARRDDRPATRRHTVDRIYGRIDSKRALHNLQVITRAITRNVPSAAPFPAS